MILCARFAGLTLDRGIATDTAPVDEEGKEIALTDVVPEALRIEAGYHKASMPC